jgi:imidazolonepropionase-like amidohydrolase
MARITRIALLTLVLAAAPPAALLAAGPPVLVKNATILTISHGTIPNGSILIRDGKIAEVGANLEAPAGATVIDASGQFVMPGIIDPHEHIAADATNEGSIAVSSMTDICDVLNSEDIAIWRELAGGVTTVATIHGSANPVGGSNCVIKLRWGKTAKEMKFEGAMPGLKFALGENPKRPGQQTQGQQTQRAPRYPATRMGTEDVIRQAFSEAREYMKQWDDHNRRVAAGERNLVPPRKDLKLEPLAEVLQGKRLAFVHGYREDELLMILKLSDEFGFHVNSFIHGLEAYKIAKEIAAHNTVVSTFSDWYAFKVEAQDAIPYNAALLMKKGVLVTLNSDDAQLARHMNQEAAKLLRYGGVSEEDALKTITLNPAKELHLDNRIGSIDVGKDADLAIFDKHPLSNYAKVTKVLIDGEVYFDRDRALKHQAEIEKEVKDLTEKERKAMAARPAPSTPGAARSPGGRVPPGDAQKPEGEVIQ